MGAEGRSGELEGPGSKGCGSVGSKGAGGVFQEERLACHSMWSVGLSVGVVQKDGSVVEFLANHPVVSSKPFMVPGGELGVVPGALLAVHWPVTKPGAILGTSSSTPCPVLFLSCLTTPLPPLLGGGPGVWAWPAVGVPQECPGLGHEMGVSRSRAIVPVLSAGAVTPVAGARIPPVGFTTSPAETHIHSQRGHLVQKP